MVITIVKLHCRERPDLFCILKAEILTALTPGSSLLRTFSASTAGMIQRYIQLTGKINQPLPDLRILRKVF